MNIKKPDDYAEEFIKKLENQSFYFITEVTKRMIWKAEMMTKLVIED